MKKIGYSIDNTDSSKCESIYSRKGGYDPNNLLHGRNDGNSKYDYCVYKYDCNTSDGSCISTYYGVTTFMHFDIPLIGGLLRFSVNGETSLVYDVIDN